MDLSNIKGRAEVSVGIFSLTSHHAQCLNIQLLLYYTISLNKTATTRSKPLPWIIDSN